jgi:hypothetical protein
MNNQTIPSSALAELSEKFWQQLHATLSPEFARPDPAITAPLAQAFNSTLSGTNIQEPLIWMGELNEEVFKRVKQELNAFGQMHFSEPTRFQLMYFDAMAKHSAEVKRECMGHHATCRFSYLLKDGNFRNYDVEGDIKRTSELFENKKREIFSAELDFLKAIDEENLVDAEVFLRAIQAKRRNADPLMRAEANNWHHMLALMKKDLAMFVDAWNNRLPEGLVIKERLADTLQRVLYGCLVTTFALMPSPEGRLKMQRYGREAFAQEHLSVYLRSAFLDLADKLLLAGRLTEQTFREIVSKNFDDHTKVYVSINPMIYDIKVVWK